jgi:hypothetical protein
VEYADDSLVKGALMSLLVAGLDRQSFVHQLIHVGLHFQQLYHGQF